MSYLKNEVTPVINASGRMTKLGVSTQSKGVLAAMQEGASHYYLMDDLYKTAGEIIANLLETKDAVVVSSASAGISMSVAAIITQQHPLFIQKLDSLRASEIKREIVIPKGHNVDFGAPIQTMVESGNGICVEAGYANKCTIADVENSITPKTAALMYVKSSHCVQKDMLSIEDMFNLSIKHKIPMILDCAAETDFYSFSKMGIDYVIYSGSKALMGPTSGFVLVQSTCNAQCLRRQYYGVGRSMKVGKENIFGLVEAIYEYINNIGALNVDYEVLDSFINSLNTLEGVNAIKSKDESGREIYRAKVHFDETVTKISAKKMIQELENGTPQIYTRNYDVNQGYISFDPRPLHNERELDVILNRIKEILDHVKIL